MGDPLTLCLPSTSVQKTTRIDPNSGTFHKPQSLLLIPWWWLSDFKLVTYLTDQFGPPQPRTLQGSVDLSLLISCTPLVLKSCQCLLYVSLPFDLKSQALQWDLNKRESEKVKLLLGEQKKVRAFLREVSVQCRVTCVRSSGKPCCYDCLSKAKAVKKLRRAKKATRQVLVRNKLNSSLVFICNFCQGGSQMVKELF